MRTTILIGAVMAFSFVSAEWGQPRNARNTVYIAADVARTVSISRAGLPLTSMAVPRGTLLSVTYDIATSVLPKSDRRFEFHGDVEIRAMAESQKPRLILEEAMRQSPIELAATGVDVTIVPQ